MNKTALFTLVATLTLGSPLSLSPIHAETRPVAAGAATAEVTGKVMVVNAEKRMLTIRKPDGEFELIHVPEEVRRLDEIKINDTLTISYMKAVAIDLQKGAAAGEPGVAVRTEVDRESGRKPAGSMVETIRVTGKVESLNRADSTVTIRGPEKTVTLTVQDPALFDEVAVGDSVTATVISAVAAKVD